MIDVSTLVVADEIHPDERTGRPGATWILAWKDGDSTAMTEDEADQLANALRFWAEHGSPKYGSRKP